MNNNDIISLNIPSKPEYLSLVRLVTSGIAHEANLTIEELEDIKVSVGEACVNVINLTDNDFISLNFTIEDELIIIEIADVVDNIPDDYKNKEEANLGLLIIKSLMDKVEFKEDKVRIIKYIE